MATVEQIKRLTVVGSEQGLDQVRTKLDAVSAAQQKVATSGAGLAASNETVSKSVLSVQRDFDRLSKTIDPVARATAQLELAQRVAARAINENSGNADQAARNLFLMKQRLDQAILATQQHSNVVALNRGQLQNLSFQLNDMLTGLMSGQSPFMIMAQQGGQVFQALQQGPQGVGGSLKALGSTLLGLVTPARLAMVGIAAIGAAGLASWSSWEDKIRSLERSLNGLGRASGQTMSGMTDLAMRGTGRGLTSGQSFAAVGSFAGAGIDGGISDQLLGSTRKFSGAFGLGISEATDELTKAFRDPVQGAQDLGRRFGTFGANIENQIRRQAAMNDMEGARATLMRAYLDDLTKTKDATGLLTKAMEAASQRMSKAWSWLGSKVDSGQTESQVDLATLIENRRRADPRNRNMISRLDREISSAQERQIMDAGAPFIQPAIAERAAEEQRRRRQQALDIANANIGDDAKNGAAAILARTAAEKLAVEQIKIETEAKRDAARAATQAADADKARTLAVAEATRTLQDAARRINDEISMSGARTPLERIKRQTAIEFRDLGEQTNVLNGGVTGATSSRSTVSGTQGLADDFRAKLEAMIAAIPGISITDGFRTAAQQADLYRRKPHLAAPQGSSNHEYGLAADLGFADDKARSEAHRRAAEFGLTFPMKDRPKNPEDWHVEPFGARAQRRAMQGGGSGSPASNVGLPTQSDLVAARMNAVIEQMFFDTEKNVEAQRRALDANAKSFGKSTEEIARSNEQIRLENEVRRQGITDLTAYRATIEKLAAAEGQLAAAREKEAERQQKTIAAMDSVRDSARDLIGSPLKAIARGEKPGEALKQAGLRVGDKLIDGGVNSLTEMLLGKNGKAGGGLFGDLLGGFIGGDKTTANMNVQAGNVIVNGGIGGLGGGGGGGIFGSLFGGGGGLTPGSGGLYALGAAFSRGSVVPFAGGGLTTGPVHFPMAGGKTGLMGEAGTEAVMPLKRGADGKLGVAASLGRGANDNGGGVNFHAGTTQLIVNGNVGNETMPKIQDMLSQHADRIEAAVMKNVTRNLAGIQTANAARYSG